MASTHHPVSSSDTVEQSGEMECNTVGITEDPGQNVSSLDQATFFRSVASGHLSAVTALLKNRNVDVNAYNDQGVTALIIATYTYGKSRSVEMTEALLGGGAKASFKADSTAEAVKVNFVKHASKDGNKEVETRKVSLSGKTPLLIALELKSSLYLKGWEYRHWDALLEVLASATVAELKAGAAAQPNGTTEVKHTDVPAVPTVQDGWAAVLASGKHEVVELWAEKQHVSVLKHLLATASKRLRFELDKAAKLSSSRIEIADASFTVVKAVVEFLYTGTVPTTFLEMRGIDLLLAAHKYEIQGLKEVCVNQLNPTQDNWIKMLTAALEVGSDALVQKIALSIHSLMQYRSTAKAMLRPTFSLSIHPEGGPEQPAMMARSGSLE